MASSPELPSGEMRASSPATGCGIATHAQKGGETPAHVQREDAPVSVGKPARENQRGNASTTIDTGTSGGLTRDVTVLVILVQ